MTQSDKYEIEAQETKELLKKFTQKTHDKYDTHAFSSGYLEVMAGQLLMRLPRTVREEYRRQIEQHLAGL